MVTGIVQHRSLRRMSWSTDGRAVVRRWRSPQAGSGSWPAAVQDRRAGAAVPPGPISERMRWRRPRRVRHLLAGRPAVL